MKRLKLKTNFFWTLSVVIGLLIFLHWLGALTWLENIVHQALRPMNQVLYQGSTGLNQEYQDSQDQRNLADVVRQQQEEIMKLQADLARLKAVADENLALRSYFQLFSNDEYDYVMSKVVSRDVISRDAINHNRLIIDRGAKDGLKVGLIVVNQSGVAVGKISKIKDHLAEVSLLNSPDCRLAVTIQNSDQTIGLSQGDLGLTIRLDFVAQSQKLEVGQMVVSSGLEPNVPSGILIAKIKSVDKSVNEIWQKITVEPIANLDNLRWLAVLLPKGSFIFE